MKKRMLIVDDSVSIRAATEFTLQAAGYDVSEAENGRAGGRSLRLAGQTFQVRTVGGSR